MGSALLDHSAVTTPPPDVAGGEYVSQLQYADSHAASALRQEAAARLAAHRLRRGSVEADSISPSSVPRNTRSAKIAAAVAQRYAQTPSYKDFLAAEAERVVQQACAAAEVAALKAEALAAAQQSLLDALEAEERGTREPIGVLQKGAAAITACIAQELKRQTAVAPMLWPDLAPEEPATERRPFQPPVSRRRQTKPGHAEHRADSAGSPEPMQAALAGNSPSAADAAGITIRLYQDENGATRVTFGSSAEPRVAFHLPPTGQQEIYGPQTEEEARLLDEEIAFRHEPVFEEPAGPSVPLPANLIEFPRQLVASRKARPRLAEGPLRESDADAPGASQLRIFEVDAAQIETAVEGDASAAAAGSAQWAAIWLDSQPQSRPAADERSHAKATSSAQASVAGLADVASPRRRVLAAAIDAATIIAAFGMCAAIAFWIAAHVPVRGAGSMQAGMLLTRAGLQAALPFAVCAFALLGAIYQALFFAFSTATPGMRCARIALCTFSGENPKRSAVRRRLLALLLSAAPMGLGFLWAGLDEERLSWHDRLCGIYQRSY
jgi:uncharacterized RDD family membrane protein YckC